MSDLTAKEYQGFEQIKHRDESGNEYWLARELAPLLEYTKWENFQKVIDRAMLACRNSGFNTADQFPEVRKLVDIGSATKRGITDYRLSRYACYLIVQNGDPRKKVIATGQTSIAIQTRRQEVANGNNKDSSRFLLVRQMTRQRLGAPASSRQTARRAVPSGTGCQPVGLRSQQDAGAARSAEILLGGRREAPPKPPSGNSALPECRQDAGTPSRWRVFAPSIVFQPPTMAHHIKRVNGTLPESHPTPSKSIAQIQREQLKKLKSKKTLMLDE